MLDDIFEVAHIPSGSQFTPPFTFTGFRPGLRGTEMQGRWYLVVMDTGVSFAASHGTTNGIYFRQVRLEIGFDSNRGPSFTYASKNRRFAKKNVTSRPGLVAYSIQRDTTGYTITGSFVGSGYTGVTLNRNTCQTFVQVGEQYGQSTGITDATGSQTDFAVFTRLTGALADRFAASASLASSGTAHALYSYLHNQFGTPYIPISSGSGQASAFQYFNTDDLQTKSIISSILRSRPTLPQAHRLRDTVARLGGVQKMSDAVNMSILAALSGST
jgi:hypothetical protein